VRKYLAAYSTILNKKTYFRYAYIDAFAGTGFRELKQEEDRGVPLFPEFDLEAQKFFDGSPRIALQVEPRFHKYIFIEKNQSKVRELEKLKDEFQERASDIIIINEDANQYIAKLCDGDWKKRRAVLFLDPFGMNVSWEMITAIGRTKAIDLWYLFSIMGVNRLLKNDGNIEESNRKKLDKIFGTTDWYDNFYRARGGADLFGEYSWMEKTADGKSIGQYFVDRLKTVFPGLAENPLFLYNSRNAPLFLLCFAASNEKGAQTAIKIVQHILKK
ncbi:MAG: three-Cys-motif partner protein TcmP, partial [Okeania sp. SIO2H7]|nr:three-Cys-motif partner protein TcmP [Okeania sp. SIO2H7]